MALVTLVANPHRIPGDKWHSRPGGWIERFDPCRFELSMR